MRDIIEDLKEYFEPYLKKLLDKDNYTFLNAICFSTAILSIIFLFLGFYTTVNSIYIGDTIVRMLFLFMGFLFLTMILYLFIRENLRFNLIRLIILMIFIFIIGYYLPQMAPYYDLTDFDIDASILKFLFTSIMMMIIGAFSLSYSLKPVYNFSKRSNQYSAVILLIFSVIIIIYPLAIIIGNLLSNGIGGISWEFLTEYPSSHGEEGGIYPALVGTLILVVGTAIIALPLGIGAAIFLTEYAKEGLIIRIIRVSVDILQGIPSIVFGLFAFAVFVPMFGICVLNGILILSILTLPIVIRSSEEAIRSVPQDLREGSYAVGATKWQTIRRVVLPPALPGIITGGVLGLGRAAGETAPIMFVAVVTFGGDVPTSIYDPIMALQTHLLDLTYKIGAYEVEQNAWATALLLLSIVLGINAIAIILREKFRVEF